MAFPGDYTLLRKIPIDATAVSGSNDDFTGLITEAAFKLSKTFIFANTDNGGGDVRFSTDAAGLVQIAIDVVSWDTSGETCQVWYLADGVDDVSPTDLYLWGDNTGDSQPAVGAAFGRNAVYVNEINRMHMESATPIDSTGNQTSITANAVTAEAGNIGNALRFNGTSSDIDLGAAILPTGDFTQSAWINPDDLNNFQGVIGNFVSPDIGRTYLGLNSSSYNWDGYATSGNARGTATALVWQMLTVTRTGSTVTILADGVQLGSTVSDAGTPDASHNTFIGALTQGTDNFYDGLIGDNFLSDTFDSNDKVLTKYNNQSDVAGFYLEPESVGITITVTEQGPSFTEIINATLSTLTIQANITESGPGFTEAINATVTSSLVINASIAEQGPSFTDSISANLDVNISAAITELGPSFTESINISVIGDRVAAITENGPSFVESIIASIPITITVNPKNIIRVKRKSNTVIIKRKSNTIRVK